MLKSARARSVMFSVLKWIISIVFAAFLIGLGGLVIGDLPKAAESVTLEQFMDQKALAALDAEQKMLDARRNEAVEQVRAAEAAYTRAMNDVSTQQKNFDDWVATRTATTDASQDPEVINRTRALEALRQVEREALQVLEDRNAAVQAIDAASAKNSSNRLQLEANARPAYEQARFVQELQIFGLRLAFTLPLLALGAFFLFQKKSSSHWPLRRGFVLFAAFTFFFELAPYLPDYGGYVHAGVGILLTVIASHFILRWLRNYLATRDNTEKKAEIERKQSIKYDEALTKYMAKTCPACDRTIATTGDAPADFCVHCGMRLFDHCVSCSTRKFAFFRFCMTCGTSAKPAEPAQA